MGRTCRGDGSAAVLGPAGDRDREIADRKIDVFDDHGFPVPDGVLTGVAGADGDCDLVETGPFGIEIEDDGVGAGASLDQSWGVDLDATVPYCDGVIDHSAGPSDRRSLLSFLRYAFDHKDLKKFSMIVLRYS